MCLGIPGKLLEIRDEADPPMGRAAFGAIEKEVCLAYTPEARVGDYVLVHVGFAIGVIDQSEADETMRLLQEIEAAAHPPAAGP